MKGLDGKHDGFDGISKIHGDVVSVVNDESSGNPVDPKSPMCKAQTAAASMVNNVEAATAREQHVPGDQLGPCGPLSGSHASHEPCSDAFRAEPPGGDTSKGLDQCRDEATLDGAAVRLGDGGQERQGPLAPSSDDHRVESCQEGKEGEPEVVCVAEPQSALERQRDHRDPDVQGPTGHLRSGRELRDGSSRIRSPCRQDLWRHTGGGEGLRQVGCDHSKRRPTQLLTPPDAVGQVAAQHGAAEHESKNTGSLLPPERVQGEDQYNDRDWNDICRHQADAVKLQRCHDPDDATVDDHGEPTWRGSPGSQGRAPTQEGGQSCERSDIRELRDDAAVSEAQTFETHVQQEHSTCAQPEGHHESVVRKLPTGLGRSLGSKSDRLVADTLQELALYDRVALLEIACSQESILSKTMHDLTGSEKSAQRLSLWNNFDLSTNDGVRSVLDKIDTTRPSHVWISMECGPYSVMQNINQRTDAQKEELARKRREVLKQYVGGAIVYSYCIQKGIHVTWEWSQSCQAWRLPLVQQLAQRYQVYFAITRGCQVNLRDLKGRFVSKGWKLMTTHPLLAVRMSLPCQCGPRVEHVACEGSLTRKSAFYTAEFAKRVCETILQGTTTKDFQRELHGHHSEGDMFGKGTFCVCKELQQHGSQLKCGACRMSVEGLTGLGLAAEEQGPCQMSSEEIQKRLYLLHSATGHSPVRYLIQSLKKRGVHPQIIREAERFKCTVCEEKGKPQPRNRASLEPQPQRFDVLTADVGHFIHPQTGEHHQFVLMVDEGSRFKVGRVVLAGKKKHISAALFIKTMKEAWTSYFGNPKSLRLDPDGAFRSHGLSEYCDQHHIFLDLVPSEGHWKLGVCERAVQATKSILEKVLHEHPDTSAEDALSETIRALNCREVIRGYSPIQHVLGKSPDETDRIFNPKLIQSPEVLADTATTVHHQTEALRLSAEKAFLEWNANDRLQRASQSRHRRVLNFSAGDLVYIWRKQVTGDDAKPGNNTKGRFVGPARILATEQRRDDQGHLIAGSSVWLVRGRRLLKCCPEQLRHASDREKVLEELHSPDPQPWTFSKVA